MVTKLQQQSFHAESELLEWASQYISVEKFELVSDHDWAKTYRILNDGTHYYLKDLPPEQTRALPATSLLYELFPKTVPKVIACNPEEGLLLLADHGGQEVGKRPSSSQRKAIIGTYASLQAQAAQNSELLSALPKFNLSTVLDHFLEFLEGNETVREEIGLVGAGHFLGQQESRNYFEMFSARKNLLGELLEKAEQLPATINHCDLRPQNTAIAEDGACLIFDWDEAIAGPAGLSLHNSFSGCSQPAKLLIVKTDVREDKELRRASRLLKEYISVLLENGYADIATLQQSLPGSICAGVMHYLMSYSKFPSDSDSSRKQVAGIFQRRMDDMLELCDMLAANSRETTLQFVDDYEQSDSLRRAATLLKCYLDETPADSEIQCRLASIHYRNGETEEAEKLLRMVIKQSPNDPTSHEALGNLLFNDLKFDEAIDHLEAAVRLLPENQVTQEKLAEASELNEMLKNAARPGCVPTIKFSPTEVELLTMSRVKRKLAARLFRKYGCLLIENAFSPELLDKMADQFFQNYQPYFADTHHDDALRVGDKRFMITVEIEGVFNSPDVYNAPLVLPIIKRILGDDCILGSFTSVTSLPKSEDMKMHKDHPTLFDNQELSKPLPSFAVTMLVPLLGISE